MGKKTLTDKTVFPNAETLSAEDVFCLGISKISDSAVPRVRPHCFCNLILSNIIDIWQTNLALLSQGDQLKLCYGPYTGL